MESDSNCRQLLEMSCHKKQENGTVYGRRHLVSGRVL